MKKPALEAVPLSDSETNHLLELLQVQQVLGAAYVRASQARVNAEIALREALKEEAKAKADAEKNANEASPLAARLEARIL